jgi:hypothetical protein
MSTLKLRLIPDLSGGGNSRTELEPAYEFYLRSADGRVYRNSGWGVVMVQNIARFDFDATRSREPQNVGGYIDDGDHVTIQIQGQNTVATIVAGGALRIGNSTYERTGFSKIQDVSRRSAAGPALGRPPYRASGISSGPDLRRAESLSTVCARPRNVD